MIPCSIYAACGIKAVLPACTPDCETADRYLIGFNYSSLLVIFKNCQTCPGRLANFVQPETSLYFVLVEFKHFYRTFNSVAVGMLFILMVLKLFVSIHDNYNFSTITLRWNSPSRLWQVSINVTCPLIRKGICWFIIHQEKTIFLSLGLTRLLLISVISELFDFSEINPLLISHCTDRSPLFATMHLVHYWVSE